MSNDTSKTQVEFYIAKGEEHLGPWTIAEIAERVARSEVAVTDFIFDEAKGDWIPLLQCAAFNAHLNRAKPKAPPPPKKTEMKAVPKVEVREEPVVESKASASAPTDREEWYVQKGTQRHGPFTYFGLVRALQEKLVYDFDFCCRQGEEEWVRIAEHPEFQSDRIRELAGKMTTTKTEDPGVFFRRKHPRIPFESEVIVHDDRSVWMGQAFEASAGGSGVVIENATLTPGQVIRIHFAPCDGLPAFNALGEIVGKRFSKEVRGAKSPVKYAVRFLQVDGTAEPAVREYFEAKAS